MSQERTSGEISAIIPLAFGFLIMLSVTLACWTFGKNNDGYIWGWATGMLGVSSAQMGGRNCVATGIGLIFGILVAYLGYYLVTGSELAITVMGSRAFVGMFWALSYFALGAIIGAIIYYLFLRTSKVDNQ